MGRVTHSTHPSLALAISHSKKQSKTREIGELRLVEKKDMEEPVG